MPKLHIRFLLASAKTEGAFILPFRFLIYKDLVFEATSVFEAATIKTDCGTEA